MRPLKSGLYDPTPNLLMRHLQHKCYGNDVDYRWYVYDLQSKRTKTLALWEWKHPSQWQSTISFEGNSALKANCDLADELRVPFFIGVTMTKDETLSASRDCSAPQLAPAPTLYVIAGNKPAHEALETFPGYQGAGVWMAGAELVALQKRLGGNAGAIPESFRPSLQRVGLPGKEIDISNEPKQDMLTLSRVSIDWQSLKSYSSTWG